MKESVIEEKTGKRLQKMTMTALMTAVICILAPLSIPIGPVPISFTALAIYLSLYLLGWKLGTVSCLIYILLGAVGLPVFSGFSGGIGKLLGPTGGYIIGFLPMAALAGAIIERYHNRFIQFSAMTAGMALCYVFGTIWFCIVMKTTVAAALSACVFPFIPGDMIKIMIALTGGPILKKDYSRQEYWKNKKEQRQ